MLRIPLAVYLSDRYVRDNPDIFEALKENKDKYFSNDLIFDLTARVMGISGLPDMENRLNLADKSYSLDKQSVLSRLFCFCFSKNNKNKLVLYYSS